MFRKELLDDLLNSLEKTLESHVVVMPDFFLDRVVTLTGNTEDFAESLRAIIAQKGGSIDWTKQSDTRGGNAINTASALSALGIRVTPIVCTSKQGLELLKMYFKGHRIDLSHTKIFEKPSITTALEFESGSGRVNAMLRDVGALDSFSPDDLNESDYRLIQNADYVCVFNWAGTRQFGTVLAETVFKRAKTCGRGKVYYDTADPQPNSQEIPRLLKKVLLTDYVDILSVNENEAVTYAAHLSKSFRKAFPSKTRLDEAAREAAQVLASCLRSRVDLHTTRFSATFTRRTGRTVAAVDVKGVRATGAGDAWNAGNILGDALGVSDECRLTLANLVAGYFVSNPAGAHPTRKQLISFIRKLGQKQREHRS